MAVSIRRPMHLQPADDPLSPSPAVVVSRPLVDIERLVVVHDDLGSSVAGAERLLPLFPHADVLAAARGIEAITGVRDVAAGRGLLVVHVQALRRFDGRRSGLELARRMTARGHLVVAWHDPSDVDTRVAAAQAGCLEMPDVCRCLNQGLRATIDAPLRDAGFEPWFRHRYGRAWEPEIETALALLAAGGERTELAEMMLASGAADGFAQARHRLRAVAEMLTGEVRGNDALVHREALVVLQRIAQIRPIRADVSMTRSLGRAARAIANDPGVAFDAGLTSEEVEALLAVHRAEQQVVVGRGPRRGRPASGSWRARRAMAVARVAAATAADRHGKAVAAQHLRQMVADAVQAVHDALDDEGRRRGIWVRSRA